MDNQMISNIFNDVYNKWWTRWRNVRLDIRLKDEWDKLHAEVLALEAKYNNCDLVCSMLTSLVMELDRRAREAA